MRRSVVAALCMVTTAVSLSTASRTLAQAYPSRPVTLIVSFAAGGGIDLIARILAENLQQKLHRPVVVENRPGAGGELGTSYVAAAAPDGYTLLLMEASSVLGRLLRKNSKSDVMADFAPIAMAVTNYLGLFANVSLPVNDAKQLVTYSKANPGKLSVGTPGLGTPHHLAVLMFNEVANIEIAHVPYRGTPPSVRDLVSGQIPLIWAVPVNVVPLMHQGKVKALGVSAPRRLSLLPQVPTIAENVSPGFEVALWLGIAAPTKTPPEIISQLESVTGEILRSPDIQARISALGYTVDFRDGAAFRKVIAADQEKYGGIIREAGIEPQ